MGDVDSAIEQYEQTVKRWPDSPMSLNALGYTLADRTNRYGDAAKLIKKALKMQPESPAIIDSWGWVLHRQGKNEEALQYLEKAYEQLSDPEVAGHIVEVLMALDRREDAAVRLAEAELLFPDNDYLKEVRRRYLTETP
jgi:tetratricopeptide (TPR) repeat protein